MYIPDSREAGEDASTRIMAVKDVFLLFRLTDLPKIIVVWECQLRKGSFEVTVSGVRRQLEENRLAYSAYMSDRRERSEEWLEEIERRKLRAEELMEELKR